jgi:gamma-glutamyltranspeptidase/glutathione hydrolase
VDRQGNIVLLTHSLGAISGVVTGGLGFIYNGAMSRFDPRPGRSGSLAPGKRRASSAAPTIVFRDKQPWVAVGAPGGSHIAPAVGQCVMNVVDFSMSMLEAVSAPRAVAVTEALDISNRIKRSVSAALQRDGYDVRRSPSSYGFAALHGIMIEGSVCTGGADPWQDGVAYSCR